MCTLHRYHVCRYAVNSSEGWKIIHTQEHSGQQQQGRTAMLLDALFEITYGQLQQLPVKLSGQKEGPLVHRQFIDVVLKLAFMHIDLAEVRFWLISTDLADSTWLQRRIILPTWDWDILFSQMSQGSVWAYLMNESEFTGIKGNVLHITVLLREIAFGSSSSSTMVLIAITLHFCSHLSLFKDTWQHNDSLSPIVKVTWQQHQQPFSQHDSARPCTARITRDLRPCMEEWTKCQSAQFWVKAMYGYFHPSPTIQANCLHQNCTGSMIESPVKK